MLDYAQFYHKSIRIIYQFYFKHLETKEKWAHKYSFLAATSPCALNIIVANQQIKERVGLK